MGSISSETEPEWQRLAKAHRASQQDNIPQEWRLGQDLITSITSGKQGVNLIATQAAHKAKILTPKEIEITEKYTAVELLSQLKAGRLTSLEVTTAFCKRAAIAQQLTSCLTEIFFQKGLKRAQELDESFKANGKVTGPLHGLPISLKDSFVVEGNHATVGYTEFLRRPHPKEQSALVKLLLDAGAVLYCKTNIPQTMMSADSENNIFGRALNPHNTSLTAGGSSGGEGALAAFRGSPLGVGTDIAGSIRIPSLCCGTYGFKPTATRIPFGGQIVSPFPREHMPDGVLPVAGPMGNSIEDLEAFMSIVSAARPWNYDHTCSEVQWRPAQNGDVRLLRIGVPPEDTEYTLQPPVKRALEDAVFKLQQAGHTIVRLPQDESRSFGLGARIAFCAYAVGHPPMEEFAKEIGEPFVKSIALGVHPFSKHPPPVTRDMNLGQTVGTLITAKHAYSKSWNRAFVENELDVVLSPGAQTTAVPHDEFGVPAYTCSINVLDYPACIIPYGKASKTQDPDRTEATAAFDPPYVPEAVDGAPCAVQVIAPRFRDEQCLYASRIIDEILNPKGTSN